MPNTFDRRAIEQSCRWGHAHPQHRRHITNRMVGRVGGQAHEIIDAAHEFGRPLSGEQCDTGWLLLPPDLLEQRNTPITLKALQCHGDCRLADAHPARCPGEATAVDDRPQIEKRFEVHGIPTPLGTRTRGARPDGVARFSAA